MRSNEEKWKLFWCNLLHCVIFDEVEKGEINQHLKSLCQKEHMFPDGKCKKPSMSTLRRKLKQYRQGGFSALKRKSRNDKSKARSVSEDIINKAIELKKEQPYRSDDIINRFLKEQYGKTIPKSTLYRHLKKAGATKIKLGVSGKKVRKRWTRDRTHDLWLGDFQEGPYVLVNDETVQTHLLLFIDCHSRYIVDARYYLRQNLEVLIDALIRAWSIHGTSKELYLDNAKVYHSDGLKSACYHLGINLLHRPAGDPAPGGLVERIFGTAQQQFEAEVRMGNIMSLSELNKSFSAYVNVCYHQRVHSETKETPQQRYERSSCVTRNVDMNEVLQFFMKHETRRVDKDFSDIRLAGKLYRVDPALRRDKVQVRYDPFSDMKVVWIYSLDDEYLGTGKLYHRDYGAEIKRVVTPFKNSFINLLNQQHNKQLEIESKGIDFRYANQSRSWPFISFVQKLAKLMGLKGKLNDFNAGELETLKKLYNSIVEINESMLVKAFKNAHPKTIASVAYQLRIIKNKKKEI